MVPGRWCRSWIWAPINISERSPADCTQMGSTSMIWVTTRMARAWRPAFNLWTAMKSRSQWKVRSACGGAPRHPTTDESDFADGKPGSCEEFALGGRGWRNGRRYGERTHHDAIILRGHYQQLPAECGRNAEASRRSLVHGCGWRHERKVPERYDNAAVAVRD